MDAADRDPNLPSRHRQGCSVSSADSGQGKRILFRLCSASLTRQICVVIQGIIDALIYGINESSLSAWQSLIFPRPQASLERRRSVYRLASRARSKRLRHLVRASDASLDGSLEASSAAHIRRSQYDSEAADRSSEGLVGNSHGISIHRTVEVHVTYGNCQPYARGSS